MPAKQLLAIISDDVVVNKIYEIRSQKVMLDSDLAELYGVETKRLNEQVGRNIGRFPDDFMFQLSEIEWKNLKSQFATSSWGGRRKLPFVFTEHGVLMLSSVLNSQQAIQVNIQIVRIFTRLIDLLNKNYSSFNHPAFQAPLRRRGIVVSFPSCGGVVEDRGGYSH